MSERSILPRPVRNIDGTTATRLSEIILKGTGLFPSSVRFPLSISIANSTHLSSIARVTTSRPACLSRRYSAIPMTAAEVGYP